MEDIYKVFIFKKSVFDYYSYSIFTTILVDVVSDVISCDLQDVFKILKYLKINYL